MKKTLNKLGAGAAFLLSVILVLVLILTPMLLSVLSLLNGETIANIVSNTFTAGQETQPSAETVKVVTLSSTTQAASAENIGEDLLKGMFGDSVGQEQLGAIMSSKAAKALIEAYASDLTNAITGGSQGASFNADKIKSIVNENMDELVQVLQANVPELADMDAAELKSKIQSALDEGAEEIVNALPKAEDILGMTGENPALKAVTDVLAKKDTIKLALIGAIVVLCGLIFVCRLPGVKGFIWLAVDLFVGGGINGIFTGGLIAGKSALGEVTKQAGPQIGSLVESLLKKLTSGVMTGTIIMLVVGGAMVAAYILIKKQQEKKTIAEEIAVEEIAVEEIAVEEIAAEEIAAEEAVEATEI